MIVCTFLLAFFVAPPQGDLRDAVLLAQKGDHDASEAILSRLPGGKYDTTYPFYRMVNTHALNRKKEAIKWAEIVRDSFGDVPMRHRELAEAVLYDTSNWVQEDDDLADISRDMKRAADRLRNGRADKVTRQIQNESEARLKRMIDEIEDAQKKALEKPATASDIAAAPTPPPDTPAVAEPPSTGMINVKRVKEIAEVWGKLPEKERASALRELTRTLPAYDKKVIDDYFRNLAKGKR